MEIFYCGRESVMALPLDLQDFIVRAQVLKLYRQALRTARRAPGHARGNLRFRRTFNKQLLILERSDLE